MDNKGQNIENKNMDDKLPADDEKDELPDYEDDEDFKRLMNEALMRNMNRLENESNSTSQYNKAKKNKK